MRRGAWIAWGALALAGVLVVLARWRVKGEPVSQTRILAGLKAAAASGALSVASVIGTSAVLPSSLAERVKDFAQAISKAEGFGPAANLATRANNPGNLKAGDKGLGVIHGKTVFASVADGWAALERQIMLMVTGRSAFYKPSMTISEVARVYTGGDKPDAWARIVAGFLGVTPQTTLADFFGVTV